MILAKSWWDSGGSEAVFLIVGSVLTISAGLVAETVRFRREKARRSADWQRANLLDLQDALVASLGAFIVVMEEIPQRRREDPALTLRECERPGEFRALLDATRTVEKFASRLLDEDLRASFTAWRAAVVRFCRTSTWDAFQTEGEEVYRLNNVVMPGVGMLLRKRYS